MKLIIEETQPEKRHSVTGDEDPGFVFYGEVFSDIGHTNRIAGPSLFLIVKDPDRDTSHCVLNLQTYRVIRAAYLSIDQRKKFSAKIAH